ncbi:hypothetical protein RCC89_12660 [Cytophagaceae bacterium ABcell3]|nr:hypothetical protein RCC89_12660 [Cytophagaceae bacterium ABcell3]
MDIYYLTKLEDSIRIDSSLALTNKALALDGRNISALQHKNTLLFLRKDINELLQVTDKLIKISPERPFYLGKKALFLELAGDSLNAVKYYQKAIDKYREYLSSDTVNFDLMLEYVGVLEASGHILLAEKTLSEMKKMDLQDYQNEIIDLYKKQKLSKKQLIKYWNGEIQFNEIEGN